MEPDEALRVTRSVAEDERSLRLIIEATPNAMLMVDRRGRIVLVNTQTEILFGYPRSSLLGMPVEQLIPERFGGGHHAYRKAYFERPDTRSMGAGRDLYGRRSDGTEVPIEIGLNPLQTDDGTFVLASIIDITERKRSEERLLRVVEAAPNAMIMVNEAGRIVLVNSQAERSFGYDRHELLEKSVEDLVPERFRSQHARFRGSFFGAPDRREMGAGRELYGLRKDGTEMPIEIGLNPIQVAEEHFVLASVIEITERLQAQAAWNALREHQLRRSILDSLPFSIIVADGEDRIVTANPAAERLLDYGRTELVGASLRDINGGPAAGSRRRPRPAGASGDEREGIYLRKDGTQVPVNEAIVPMRGGEGEQDHYLAVAYDITKRIEARARVEFLATHDALTSLPNRTLLVEHLVGLIDSAEETGGEVAVLLLDLDHFKRVNDSLGHHVGDQMLLRVAERLRSWIRSSGIVARLGGDEFVVVFGEQQTPEQLEGRVRELQQHVLTEVEVGGHRLAATASVGGAVYPHDGVTATALMKHADIAMYQAKSAGRNNVQWFSRSMLDDTNDRIALASALRQALGSGELTVHYQPQVDLATGRVVGLEALARWFDPVHGWVAPDRFIPVAEEGGMIAELGRWVLRQACTDLARFQRDLGPPLRMAVNVSPRQFHSREWLGEVMLAVEAAGIAPEDLELEITEGILMEDHRDVVAVLQAIRDLGVMIVVDDFGQGYSSLAYLTRFPVDKIKIDRAFVQQLGHANADAAIVDAIIGMAHALGVSVVAEGVETDQQARYLAARGCEEAQGYHYSAGVPAREVVPVVRAIRA